MKTQGTSLSLLLATALWCVTVFFPLKAATAITVEEGRAHQTPWSGWWWPFRQGGIQGPLEKYDRITKAEVLYEADGLDDAELILVAFGTAARISKSSVRMARKLGVKAGFIRPITLFPFPEEIIQKASERTKNFLVVELNAGQMVEDVRLSVTDGTDVQFYGRPCGAGSLPKPKEVLDKIMSLSRAPSQDQENQRGTRHETRV